jgi:hypothetical protein
MTSSSITPSGARNPSGETQPNPAKNARRPQYRAGAAVAVAAVVALGVWLAVRDSGNGSVKKSAGAVAVSRAELTTIANTLGHPIYWAGPQRGITYELTQTPDGRIYVRYLPVGVPIGSPHPYPTIATYPIANSFAATARVARKSTSAQIPVRGGAVAFYNPSRPTNVYEAFPGSDYQIEVFAPSAKVAQGLVAANKIHPLGNGRANGAPETGAIRQIGAVRATLTDIQKVATTLGRPVYWAGSEPGKTYELTKTPDGRVYVRYLPAGVAVGADKPYLTVATYPLQNAYSTTLATANEAGAVKIPVEEGVAFYTPQRPTSVYIALKGIDEQIEVFDPSAAKLHRLVAAGKVQPAS